MCIIFLDLQCMLCHRHHCVPSVLPALRCHASVQNMPAVLCACIG
jgi:hypothetical protein